MDLGTVSNNGLGKDMWTLPLYKIENVLFVSTSDAQIVHESTGKN